MQTADGVEITHHLRVWVRGEPATVDLYGTRTAADPGRLVIRTDTGRAAAVRPTSAAVTHGLTGHAPPPLGLCQWVRSCGRAAVRMHPHPLMSPVPVCPTCITDHDLQ